MFAITEREWQGTLLVVLLLGGVFRFYGLSWGTDRQTGYFHPFHPDESTLVEDARWVGVDLSRMRASYGKAPIYLLWTLAQIGGGLFGVSPFHLDDNASLKFTHILGRGVSALMGTVTLWLVFLIGRRWNGPWMGVLAAFLLAFSAGHIQQSHYYTVDPALAFWAALFLFLCLKLPAPDKGYYLLLGGICGLAIGTRLVGIWLVVPFLIAHLWHRSWRTLLNVRVALFCLAAGVITLACEPFLLLDPGYYTDTENLRGFLPSMQVARGEVVRIWTLYDFSTTPYLYYITHLFRYALGAPLEIAALVGIFLGLWRREKCFWILLGWVLPYFLLVGGLHTKPIRYVTPLLPPLALLGSWTCVQAVSWLQSYTRLRFVLALPVLLVCLPTFCWGAALIRIYVQEDSRIQAVRWIRDHIPKGSGVLAEQGGFPTAWMVQGDRYDFRDSDASRFIDAKGWSLYRDQIHFYKKKVEGADWILLIEENRMRQFLAVPNDYPIAHTLFRLLGEGKLGFEPVASFRVDPGLWDWQVVEDDIEPTFSAFDHPRVLIYRRRSGTSIEDLLERWKRTVESDRNLTDFYILNGVRAFHHADWDGALSAFEQALKVQPEFALAHLLMGEVYRKKGNRYATEQAWKRATETRGPVTIHSFVGMADAGLKAEAVVHIDDLARTNPNRRDIARLAASLYFELAHEHQKYGRHREAITAYRSVVAWAADNVPTYLNMALSYRALKETDDAVRIYRRVLQLEPKNQDAVRGLRKLLGP
ncbi:MAG: glycosyltransferase family 39 protein [bacterium]|nr:glycosyltransferase family 39 protein [bacterium]